MVFNLKMIGWIRPNSASEFMGGDSNGLHYMYAVKQLYSWKQIGTWAG